MIADDAEPVTRLSVAPEPLLKLTVPPCPTEKLFQLTIALFDDWLIVNVPFAGVPIVAVPDVTVPPLGSAGPA